MKVPKQDVVTAVGEEFTKVGEKLMVGRGLHSSTFQLNLSRS